MKVKVIQQFHDREADLKLRRVGQVYTCTEQRAQELIQRGYVKEVKKGE